MVEDLDSGESVWWIYRCSLRATEQLYTTTGEIQSSYTWSHQAASALQYTFSDGTTCAALSGCVAPELVRGQGCMQPYTQWEGLSVEFMVTKHGQADLLAHKPRCQAPGPPRSDTSVV